MGVAIVTGGAKGIGLAITSRLAAEGWKVVCAGRDESALNGVAQSLNGKGLQVQPCRCDVTEEESVRLLVAEASSRYGWPDLLVNNAGIPGPTVPAAQLRRADWDDVLAVNLTGPLLCSKAVIPGMVERGSGHIVNIASITGKRPLRQRVAYAASKLGLIGLTRTLAEELGPSGVRVNAISPGVVAGERIELVLEGQARARGSDVGAVRAEFLASTPMGRFVEPAEVAEAVIALDAMTAVTGIDLNVAAGLVMY